MKKRIFQCMTLRHALGRALLSALLIGGSLCGHAQTGVQKQELKNAAVIYNGIQNDQMSFTVKYDNPEGDRFLILLADHNGDIFYDGSFSERKFQRIFQVAKPEETDFNFVIKNLKTNESQVFEINTRLIEEVVVKKVG